MRRTALVAVTLALVGAACGGGSESEPRFEADGGTIATIAPVAVDEVEPAVGVELSAGDQFDTAGLVSRRGSGFVSLDDPEMVPASQVTWLSDDDIVMGIVADNGETQAFPVNQMAYHHIANTTVAGEPYLVTY